jgi:hypothetical protein
MGGAKAEIFEQIIQNNRILLINRVLLLNCIRSGKGLIFSPKNQCLLVNDRFQNWKGF